MNNASALGKQRLQMLVHAVIISVLWVVARLGDQPEQRSVILNLLTQECRQFRAADYQAIKFVISLANLDPHSPTRAQ